MSPAIGALLPEFGLVCLIAACATALLQAMSLAGMHSCPFTRRMPWVQLLLVFLAFCALMLCRVTDDFSVENVLSHSNTAMPLLYKIVGTWGNHEGSMVLIVLVLSLYHALFARSKSGNTPIGQTTSAFMALIGAAFLAFVLITSNPFARIFPPPEDGGALNPLLQDVGLAMHPPMLYLGYIGFALTYAMSVASLMHGSLTREWAETLHGWLLAAWSFLTVGIMLGSWWAYRELGWGGYWFWDPVENASLLPWLAATALIHANLALQKRGALAHWVLLLAILTFSMSLLGTFLVRSGAVTSVHSFAADPTRGLFILAFFAVFTGGALAMYAMRAGNISSDFVAAPLSREGMMVFNGLLFVLTLAIVLLGTVYPMLSELFFQQPLSVGAPYFQIVVTPVAAVIVLLAGIAPLVAWQSDKPKRLLRALQYPALAFVAAGIALYAFSQTAALTAAAGFAFSAWLIVATARYALRAEKKSTATLLAHMGAAVLLMGITGMSAWRVEVDRTMQVGEVARVGDEAFTLEDIARSETPNYTTAKGTLTYSGGVLQPEYRLYGIRGMATSEASITPKWWGDVYAVMGESKADSAALRLHLNPLSHLLWLSALLMAAGGMAGVASLRKRWKIGSEESRLAP